MTVAAGEVWRDVLKFAADPKSSYDYVLVLPTSKTRPSSGDADAAWWAIYGPGASGGYPTKVYESDLGTRLTRVAVMPV